jgi:hypothetical protein
MSGDIANAIRLRSPETPPEQRTQVSLPLDAWLTYQELSEEDRLTIDQYYDVYRSTER